MRIFSIFKFNKIAKAEGKSFFDLKSKEKKKILLNAARKANEDQFAVVKRYTPIYIKS